MTPEMFLETVINPALSILPTKMQSMPAKRLLLAICLQESDLKYRRQMKGPARGFPMFEISGVRGVIAHHSTADLAKEVVDYLGYSEATIKEIHAAFETDDILALAFARLLAYTLPARLPMSENEGWAQYLEAWRPGKPRPESWAANWAIAERLTKGA